MKMQVKMFEIFLPYEVRTYVIKQNILKAGFHLGKLS